MMDPTADERMFELNSMSIFTETLALALSDNLPTPETRYCAEATEAAERSKGRVAIILRIQWKDRIKKNVRTVGRPSKPERDSDSYCQ